MVCPAANLTPTIVRIANRDNNDKASGCSIKETDSWNKLTKTERLKEIFGCILVVVAAASIILISEKLIF